MTTDNTYALPANVAEEYAVGPALLRRVDSRLTSAGYVFAYAPVTVGGVDRSVQFWDTWGEVVEYD